MLAVEPFCPGGSSPSPNVVLCDDFEDGAFQTNWEIDSLWSTWPAFEFVLCILNGFGFRDGCAAWSNELVFDNEWGFYGYDAWRPFDPQSEFYVRWYQYISDPYVWGALEDKSVLLHDRADPMTAYVGTSRVAESDPNSGPGRPFGRRRGKGGSR